MSTETKKEVLSWVKTIVFALIIALLINKFVIVNANVPTSSMENTIMSNDRLIAFRLAYLFSEPNRGDIVVFKYPDNEEEWFVKRIIGLPGEKVSIIAGKVYIDDSDVPLDDVFVKETPDEKNFGPYIVPENSYFMLGDNRNISKDSREWDNKYVSKDKILGKVVFQYYPKLQFFQDVKL